MNDNTRRTRKKTGKRRAFKKLGAALIALVLLLVALPLAAFAVEEEAPVTVRSLAAPSVPPAVAHGTPLEALCLPGGLAGTDNLDAPIEVPVTWAGGYDALTAGVYSFSAVLAEGYVPESDGLMPVVIVEVQPAANAAPGQDAAAEEQQEQLPAEGEEQLPAEGEEQLPAEDEEQLPAEGEEQLPAEDEEELAEEPAGEEAPMANVLLVQQLDDGTEITVMGTLPEGTVVQVQPVALPGLETVLEDAVAGEGQTLLAYTAYDITLLDAQGNEIQPETPVEISITNPAFDAQAGTVGIAHVDDALTAAEVVAEGSSTAEVAHFSIYVVYAVGSEYTVTFAVDDGVTTDPVPAPAKVLDGDYCPAPETVPAKAGHVFMGWVPDTSNPIPFDFAATAITGDITLWAWFEPTDEVEDFDGLKNAIANAPSDNTETRITVMADIAFDEELIIAAGKNIVLSGGGALTADGSRHFTVNNGATLVLAEGNNLLLTRGQAMAGGSIYVNGGTFVMHGGAITRNSTSPDGQGGGVYASNGASFTMNGGIISENQGGTGGGVFVNGATFTMSGSTMISANTATGNGGGVHVTGRSQFALEGAALIDGNTALKNGGGVAVLGKNAELFLSGAATISANRAPDGSGAGVYVDGKFTMSGGAVTQNREVKQNGGGVNITSAGTFIMTGGEISANKATYGGGIISFGSATLRGGSVTANEAQNGGGVYIQQGKLLMDGDAGATVSANTAHLGGGVYVNSASAAMDMTKGAISGNMVTGCGGGVYIYAGTLTLSGGAVNGNKAEDPGTEAVNTGSGGAGIFVATGGKLTFTAGSISENISARTGAGVFNRGIFNMGGGVIAGNICAKSGGGVYSDAGSTFNMTSGSISQNVATMSGGGIYGTAQVQLSISGGSITGNTANCVGNPLFGGGGLVLGAEVSKSGARLSGGSTTISGNTVISNNSAAAGNGGGLQLRTGTLAVQDNVSFSGNTAANNGGGIWLAYEDLANLSVSLNCTFSGNSAGRAAPQRHPEDDALYAAQIKPGAWTAPFGQGYNNYDIAYEKGIVYTVTYRPGEHGTFAPQTTTGLLAGAATPAAPRTLTGEDGWQFMRWSPEVNPTVSGDAVYTALWGQVSPPDDDSSEDSSSQPQDGGDSSGGDSSSSDGGSSSSDGGPGSTGGGTTPPTSSSGSSTGSITPSSSSGGATTPPSSSSSSSGGATTPPSSSPGSSDGGTPLPPTIAPPADGGDNAAASVWTPNNTAPMMTSQDVLQVLQNEQVPTIVIGDAQIPLSAGSLPHMVWALVNLLLAVAGVVLAGVMVIRKVVRKKRQDGDEPAAEDENGADKHKKRRLAGLMLAVTAGVLGVLLFIFTEDTSLLMVLVDNWTLWQLVVFVVEIVGCVLTAKRRNKEQRAPGELRELRE